VLCNILRKDSSGKYTPTPIHPPPAHIQSRPIHRKRLPIFTLAISKVKRSKVCA
jgi:hypothetical protein